MCTLVHVCVHCISHIEISRSTGRVTITVHQLPEGQELSDRGSVWLWSRPLRVGDNAAGGVGAWRVPLPLDGACMALGHLLELLLLGHALEIMGLPVQVIMAD